MRQSVDDRLITEPQAAHLLALSPRSVRNLRRSGALDSLKIGRSRRYRETDVRALMEGGDVPTTSAEKAR